MLGRICATGGHHFHHLVGRLALEQSFDADGCQQVAAYLSTRLLFQSEQRVFWANEESARIRRIVGQSSCAYDGVVQSGSTQVVLCFFLLVQDSAEVVQELVVGIVFLSDQRCIGQEGGDQHEFANPCCFARVHEVFGSQVLHFEDAVDVWTWSKSCGAHDRIHVPDGLAESFHVPRDVCLHDLQACTVFCCVRQDLVGFLHVPRTCTHLDSTLLELSNDPLSALSRAARHEDAFHLARRRFVFPLLWRRFLRHAAHRPRLPSNAPRDQRRIHPRPPIPRRVVLPRDVHLRFHVRRLPGCVLHRTVRCDSNTTAPWDRILLDGKNARILDRLRGHGSTCRRRDGHRRNVVVANGLGVET
mmetsp:Transcript_8333/g.51955  ORF Transcript_8333/g.51955 Transcript_8333/m.51955 type:complete len:359 (-) Transcript_8333:109-1185(-)